MSRFEQHRITYETLIDGFQVNKIDKINEHEVRGEIHYISGQSRKWAVKCALPIDVSQKSVTDGSGDEENVMTEKE